MKLLKQYSGIILTACLAVCVLTAGCMGDSSLFHKTSTPPEPETGIASWISAMNSKDIPRLYILSPSVIRSNISEQDFIRANEGNMLLQPGVVFSELEILNKSVDGSRATITEWVGMEKPGEGIVPVRYTFQLFFENGEWKVWTNEI